jgi:N-acetylmuramoyl-L-alanine amidase-like
MIKKIIIASFMFASFLNAQIYTPKDVEICKSKFELAKKENLENKSIGDVIVAIGKSFIGTDYVAYTLEKGKTETLVVDLRGLDCTTFVVSTLALSRCIKENKTTFDNFEKQLQKIRYRNGIIDRYPSRLHYFSDWIYNNVKKGIVKDVTKEIGGVPIHFDVFYMSKYPDRYKRLKMYPQFVPIIKKQEEAINEREYYYIPKKDVSKIEDKIQNGNIIAVTTSKEGLDISHIGIAVRENDGRIHFMHEPNVGYKVQITDEPLADYLMRIKTDTGIMVLRALEPNE